MNKKKPKNYLFENSVLNFESFTNDFTQELYNDCLLYTSDAADEV